MAVTCSWDSSIHNCTALNRSSTVGNQFVYANVNVACRLAYPFSMDIVLRKRQFYFIILILYFRICMNVFKKPTITERIMRKLVGTNILNGSGVFYDIESYFLEDRTTLAMMAARIPSEEFEDDNQNKEINFKHQGTEYDATNGLNYIEAYTKSIRAVECMLKLDRLRQESAMYNMLTKQDIRTRDFVQKTSLYNTPSLRMKRCVSLPNNMALPPIPPRNSNGANRNRKNVNEIIEETESSDMTNLDSVQRQGLPISTNEAIQKSNIMDVSMVSASTSSGYASMVNSVVSPVYDARLTGIDEEQAGNDLVVRSCTVPQTMNQFTVPSYQNEEANNCLIENGLKNKMLTGNEQRTPISESLNSPNTSLSCTNYLFDSPHNETLHLKEPSNQLSQTLHSNRLNETSNNKPLFFANTISAISQHRRSIGNPNLYMNGDTKYCTNNVEN